MTRDCVSARGRIGDRVFQLIDTGGIFGMKDEPLSEKIRAKAWEAAHSADVIVFVLDGKRDISPAEEELYISMKKLDKPILVVVNKIDSLTGEDSWPNITGSGIGTSFPSRLSTRSTSRTCGSGSLSFSPPSRSPRRQRPCASPSSAGLTSESRPSSTACAVRRGFS